MASQLIEKSSQEIFVCYPIEVHGPTLIGLTQNTFAPPEIYGILDFYQTTAIRIVGAINSCFI